jgi:hypothetical protein
MRGRGIPGKRTAGGSTRSCLPSESDPRRPSADRTHREPGTGWPTPALRGEARNGWAARAQFEKSGKVGQPQAGAALPHRQGDAARTPFTTTPNVPLQANLFPVSMPGVDRSKLPTFLYLWQPDPTLERLSGK